MKEDAPTAAVLDLEDRPLSIFRVEVPKDAVLMTVKVTQSPVILDVLARKDEPAESAADAEYRSSSDTIATRLLVSRQSSPALEEGTYFVSVGYLAAGLPVVHKRRVRQVPFAVTVSFVRAKVNGVLKPGEKISSRTRADEGSVRTFVIDVPEKAKVLRIDLDEVSGTLDILARHGGPVVRNEDADDTAISELGRKTLIIDGESPAPLQSGRWYVNIVRPLDFGTVDFAVYATFSPDPPPPLLAIADIPRPADGRKRAVHATVDVATETGGASGTLLTEDGLILTNYHVVEEVAENAAEQDPVVVGVTLDPRQPARELFRGKVLDDAGALAPVFRGVCGSARHARKPRPNLPFRQFRLY